MARFVLVHGGWHGAWCFRWLARELEHLGHDVVAPDLRCEEIGLTPLEYAREVGPQVGAIVVGARSPDSRFRTSRPVLASAAARAEPRGTIAA